MSLFTAVGSGQDARGANIKLEGEIAVAIRPPTPLSANPLRTAAFRGRTLTVALNERPTPADASLPLVLEVAHGAHQQLLARPGPGVRISALNRLSMVIAPAPILGRCHPPNRSLPRNAMPAPVQSAKRPKLVSSTSNFVPVSIDPHPSARVGRHSIPNTKQRLIASRLPRANCGPPTTNGVTLGDPRDRGDRRTDGSLRTA